MKRLVVLFSVVFICIGQSHGQTPATSCPDAGLLYIYNGMDFPLNATSGMNPDLDYGCLQEVNCPTWYVFWASDDGDIRIHMSVEDPGDVDFACWGPFDTPWWDSIPCVTGISDSCTTCPSNTADSNFYPSGNLVDCSFNSGTFEDLLIRNARIGQTYILLVSNYNCNDQDITFTHTDYGTPGAAMIAENVALIKAVNVSLCDTSNGFYSVHFSIQTYSMNTCICPPVVRVVDTISGRSKILNIGEFLPPSAFFLDSIPADGLEHTLYVQWTDGLNVVHSTSVTYNAPAECHSIVGLPETVFQGRLAVFPNPSNTNLSISYELPGYAEVGDLTIICLPGVVQKQIKISSSKGQIDIDTSEMPDGIYSLSLKTAQYGTIRKKFTVLH